MLSDLDFDRPFETFEPKKLISWARHCGRQRLDLTAKFLATLPAIQSSGAFRTTGAHSIYEFAAKEGGVGPREVKDLLMVHKRLGQYWVLWRLLALGKVRLWKLQLISNHVTALTAEWWAEQILRCTRAQIKAFIAALRPGEQDADPAPAHLAAAAGGESVGGEATAESTMPRPELTADGSLGTQRADSGSVLPERASGSSEIAETRTADGSGSNPVGAVPQPGDQLGLAPGRELPSGPGGMIEEDAALPWQAAGAAAPESGPPMMPGLSWVDVRIRISPLAERKLRELQAACVAAEGPTSLGELIERLIFEAVRTGSVELRSGGSRNDGASLQLDSSGRETLSEERSPGEHLRPRVALPRKQVLECVYFSADTDWRWLPSKLGPVPMGSVPEALGATLSPARSATLRELHARAVVAARRHADRLAQRLAAKRKAGLPIDPGEGRELPVDVEVYLQARSGGYCERIGCSELCAHFHHLDPFAATLWHNPDRTLGVCPGCHAAYHSDLLVPDKDDPRILHPVEPGKPVEVSAINARVQAFKANWLTGPPPGRPGAAAS